MNDETGVKLAIAVAAISFILGTAFAAYRTQSQVEQNAIKAGVAYYTNNASGESVFKWKEDKP